MTAVDALADIADAETVIFFVLFCGAVYRSSRNVTVQYIKLAYIYRRCYFEMGGGSDNSWFMRQPKYRDDLYELFRTRMDEKYGSDEESANVRMENNDSVLDLLGTTRQRLRRRNCRLSIIQNHSGKQREGSEGYEMGSSKEKMGVGVLLCENCGTCRGRNCDGRRRCTVCLRNQSFFP